MHPHLTKDSYVILKTVHLRYEISDNKSNIMTNGKFCEERRKRINRPKHSGLVSISLKNRREYFSYRQTEGTVFLEMTVSAKHIPYSTLTLPNFHNKQRF